MLPELEIRRDDQGRPHFVWAGGPGRRPATWLSSMAPESARVLFDALALLLSYRKRALFPWAQVPGAELEDLLVVEPGLRDSVRVVLGRPRGWWHVVSPAVLAVSHHLLRAVDEEDARRFLRELERCSERSARTPVFRLRQRLRGDQQQRPGRRLSGPQALALMLAAWNAWRRGETPDRLELPTDGAGAPIYPRPI